MSNPYLITLGQAAKQAKVAKSTITRALQNGELSYVERAKNGYLIDPAELDRWTSHRPKKQELDTSAGQSETPATALLEQQIEHLRELVQVEKRRADAAENDRDEWRKQAQTLAITAEATRQPRRGLLSWFGRSKVPASGTA
jgi:excisionase family DNA binding protein